MKARTLAIASILLFIPQVEGDAPEAIDIYLESQGDTWFAVRFNLSVDHDLHWAGATRWCTGDNESYRSVVGGASWSILDGSPSLSFMAPGWQVQGFSGTTDPTTHSDVAAVSIGGVRLVSPSNNWRESCDGINMGGGRYTGSATTLAFADAAMGEHATLRLLANWTRGVEYDVAYGPLRAYRGGEADQGILDASVYAPIAPKVWAAAGTRHVIATQGDVLGYFQPEYPTTGGVTEWTCTRNGVECDLTPVGLNVPALVATEPSLWDIQLQANARFSNAAYHYMALIEFPDDTWID